MKNITIKNWKGQEYSGEWNQKTYVSKIDSKNLVRIYVDGNEINVSKEVIAAVEIDLSKIERLNRIEDVKLKIEEFINSKDEAAKFDILNFILETLIEDRFSQEFKDYIDGHKEECDDLAKKLNRLSRLLSK